MKKMSSDATSPTEDNYFYDSDNSHLDSDYILETDYNSDSDMSQVINHTPHTVVKVNDSVSFSASGDEANDFDKVSVSDQHEVNDEDEANGDINGKAGQDEANDGDDHVTSGPCMDKSSETFEHSHNSLFEERIRRCSNRPGLFIRRVMKSEVGVFGQQKKLIRSYFTGYHCCLFCGEMQSNILKHIKIHRSKPQVQRMLTLERKGKLSPIQKIELLELKSGIRKKGDHVHNLVVRNRGEGELLIARRHSEKSRFNSYEYVPCPNCLEWVKTTGLGIHQSKCTKSPSRKLTKGEAIVRAAIITKDVSTEASSLLLKEVYPIMTDDTTSSTAKNDTLIVMLGNLLLRNNIENRRKRKNYASERMRASARFLVQARILDPEITSITDIINPKHFDTAAEAALNCASPNMDDEEDLASPSSAIKIGYDLAKMANMKIGTAIKKGYRYQRDAAADFMILMKSEWTSRVTKVAHKVLRERRLMKHAELPLPSDLKKLNDTVDEGLRKLKLDPKTSDSNMYRETAKLVVTRLVLYNKRRSGELEASL